MTYLETMSWYSVQLLGDLAVFLMSEPINAFIGLGIALFAVGLIGGMMFR